MRLWSLHPSYLDVKGLLALWREGLLAQKVLEGLTKGYTRHPQLVRFRASGHPARYIALYLAEVADEADRRGYHFAREKIHRFEGDTSPGAAGASLSQAAAPASPAAASPADAPAFEPIPVTEGQLRYEMALLRSKLSARDPSRLSALETAADQPRLNRVFIKVSGPIEPWEKVREDILVRPDILQ